MSSADTTKLENENTLCDKCGAEVREGSLFCYACGADLAKEEIVEKPEKPLKSVTKRSESKRSKRAKNSAQIATADLKAIPKPEVLEPSIIEPEPVLATNLVTEEPVVETETEQAKIEIKDENATMMSAAAIRRQNRTKKATPTTIDVRWEPRSGISPSFLIGSIVLLIIVAALLALAIYLK